MSTPAFVSCPHCGETIDTVPDPGGGEEQTYIEDCAVCCRPIRFAVRYDADGDEWIVEVSGEI
jgi:hypothetical protein